MRSVYVVQGSSEVTTIPVVTMTLLIQVMGHDIQPGSLMRSTIEAIQAVHRVYVGMQVSYDSVNLFIQQLPSSPQKIKLETGF